MTGHNVMIAFAASQQNLSRLAYRIAVYQRIKHTHFPKDEEAMFAVPKPQRQTAMEQWRMARHITQMMGGKLH